MCLVIAALERSAAVDTCKVGAVATSFMSVEFGLLDSVIADFAGDCGRMLAMKLRPWGISGGLHETMVAVFVE